MEPAYTVVLSEQTLKAIVQYKADIAAGKVAPGARLKNKLNAHQKQAKDALSQMSTERFIEVLLATKSPCIFAESEIRGDGTDWNHRELALLGDINITMSAKIYDNGVWSPSDRSFKEYGTTSPLEGRLLFTPGALLNVGSAFKGESPDLVEVVSPDGLIDQEKYNKLIERRMLPLFIDANECAQHEGKQAFITLPGIGCGAFAGVFKGQMGEHLNSALQDLLEKHGDKLPHIKCVYFDPFGECKNEQQNIHGIEYRVRPATLNPGKPQLSAPEAFQESGDDFSSCTLYKIVAWDHVSWPGNDFFDNSRSTDDGVSAAATNSMESVTGIKGQYVRGAYMPPDQYESWEEVVLKNNISLTVRQNVKITSLNGVCLELGQYERTPPKGKSPLFKP